MHFVSLTGPFQPLLPPLKLTVNRRGHAAGHGNEDTPSELDVGCWQIEYKECMRILSTKKCMTAMFVDELGQFSIHEPPKDVVGKGLKWFRLPGLEHASCKEIRAPEQPTGSWHRAEVTQN